MIGRVGVGMGKSTTKVKYHVASELPPAMQTYDYTISIELNTEK